MHDVIKYVEGKMILHNSLTREDIIRAKDIFVPNLESLKGQNNSTYLFNIFSWDGSMYRQHKRTRKHNVIDQNHGN